MISRKFSDKWLYILNMYLCSAFVRTILLKLLLLISHRFAFWYFQRQIGFGYRKGAYHKTKTGPFRDQFGHLENFVKSFSNFKSVMWFQIFRQIREGDCKNIFNFTKFFEKSLIFTDFKSFFFSLLACLLTWDEVTCSRKLISLIDWCMLIFCKDVYKIYDFEFWPPISNNFPPPTAQTN